MMKNMSKKSKILSILIILIILVGIIMLATIGFNKSIIYKSGKRIEIRIEKGYIKEEVRQLALEVFADKNIKVQDVEKVNQIASIKIKDYTEEELNNFKAKIAEKYEMKEDEVQLEEVKVPTTRVRDIVLPYVFSVTLVTILSVMYVGIKNIREKNTINKIVKLLATLIVVSGLYFSIIVITRIPVNEYMMPIALVLYVATLLIGTVMINQEKGEK